MRSARSSASVWDTTSAATCLGPVAVDVVADRLRPSPRGSRPGWRARAPSRARPATAGTPAASPRRSRPSASRSAGSTLAAVHRQPGRGDRPCGGEPFDVVGHPAGADGLGLAGVAQHPERPARAGVHRGQDGLDFTGRGLGDLVQHDDACPRRAARWSGRSAAGRSSGRPGRRRPARPPPWPWSPPPHRPAVGCCGLGGGVEHRRLAVPGRGQHRPQAAALAGQHPDRRHLVLPQARLARQRRLHRRVAVDGRGLRGATGCRRGRAVRSSSARWAAVDHCGGRRRPCLSRRGSGAPPGRRRGTGRPGR